VFARIATVAEIAACLIKWAHADVQNLEGWMALAKSDKTENPAKSRVLSILGPGLITGASDDDPSGIGTYSQVGAQFGFSISWTMLFSYPLMAAIQEISGRIGRTTGRGIAGNIRRHYPASLLNGIVGLLFIANTINIGADLGAMGNALSLLIGGPDLVSCSPVFCAWCCKSSFSIPAMSRF
jgi:Mn2+/Fe2+ NRAMP family transporter